MKPRHENTPQTSFRRIAVIGLISSLVVSACQGGVASFLASGAPLNWDNAAETSLDFSFTSDGQVLATTMVRGQPARTLFDSGATISVLQPAFAETAAEGLPTAAVRFRSGRVPAVRFLPVELGTVSQELLNVAVAEMPGEADAIMGLEVFAQAVVEFDFDQLVMRIVRPDAFTPEPGATPYRAGWSDLHPTLDIELADGVAACFVVDTGFNGSLTVSNEVAEAADFRADPSVTVQWRRPDGVTNVSQGLMNLPTLELGGATLENVPVTSLPPGVGGRCRNLLGMKILTGYKVAFDMPNDRIWFSPRPGLSPVFEQVQGVAYRRSNAGLTVIGVALDSPWRDLVLPGDVVVGINGATDFPQLPPAPGEERNLVLANGVRRAAVAE